MSRFLAAVCQMTSTSDAEANLAQAEAQIREAARRGARLIATPENTNFLGPHVEKVRRAEAFDGTTCRLFSALARELSCFLLLGSFNERTGDPSRCANTSVLFGPDGERLAHYRKIHLFDVDVPDGVSFRESATVVSGAEAVVATTTLARLGLTICYDLRFGELFRLLVERGAEVILVPSAFTATTGRAHWETLVRARAIETQCWLLAPGQVGHHDDDGLRESHGQSMIVDPWGEITARVEGGTGIAVAEIDLERVEQVRRAIPVAAHRRSDLR